MKKKLQLFLSTVPFTMLLCLMPLTHLQAHHGKDFILSQSAVLPHPGDLYLIPKFNTIKSGIDYLTEIEPSVLYGINHWFAVEIHSHISNEEHNSFSYEATAPSVLFNIVNAPSGFNLGLSAEYEFSHSHHHPDNFESRIAASQLLGTSQIVANWIIEKSKHSDAEMGFSIGAKNNLNTKLALGVELQNNFNNEQGEVIAVILYNLNKQMDFNFGFGSGLNNHVDFSFYATFILEL